MRYEKEIDAIIETEVRYLLETERREHLYLSDMGLLMRRTIEECHTCVPDFNATYIYCKIRHLIEYGI